MADYVRVRREALEALFNLFDVCWNRIGLFDPGRELVSDGVTLSGIGGLLDSGDALLLDQAGEAAEPYAKHVRAVLDGTEPRERRCTCGTVIPADECGQRGFACMGPPHQGGCRMPLDHEGDCWREVEGD